ncbi:MAG: ribonuclease H-like domain-containing protein [Candidatus Acidiferrales bacterium]
MSDSFNERLAQLAALRPARRTRGSALEDERERPHSRRDITAEWAALAELLGAKVASNRHGEHLTVRRWHASPEQCSPAARALSLLLPAGLGSDDRARAAEDPAQWLFLDTETTGLAGGTGTYAFLVGIAWWDAGGLEVEQFFMRDHTEEHSVLLELSARMAERPVLVTFNGKSFDWPLLETRYRMTRSIRAPVPAAHLDLLHPARQLWRMRLPSVRLTDLERHVLSEAGPLAWTRRDDLDSALIPQLYFDHLSGAGSAPLATVFRHNEMDLRALAALSGRICALLGGDPESPRDRSPERALDLYGMSRLLGRRRDARAQPACEMAIDTGLPAGVERMAQRELAHMAKRQRDYTRAAAIWEQLAVARGASAAESAIEACEQLAIHFEHRARQPERAAEWTETALRQLRAATRLEPARARRLESRLGHRQQRLARKGARLELDA